MWTVSLITFLARPTRPVTETRLRQRTLRTCRWTVLQGARPCESGGDGPRRVPADRLSPALPRRGCVLAALTSCRVRTWPAHPTRGWSSACCAARRGACLSYPLACVTCPPISPCRSLPPTHTLPRFPAVSTCVRGPLLAVCIASSCRCHSCRARPCPAPCGALRRICRRRPSGNSRRPLRSLYVVMRVFVAWASAQLSFFSSCARCRCPAPMVALAEWDVTSPPRLGVSWVPAGPRLLHMVWQYCVDRARIDGCLLCLPCGPFGGQVLGRETVTPALVLPCVVHTLGSALGYHAFQERLGRCQHLRLAVAV